MEGLGNRLRTMRTARGLSQAEIALALGVARSDYTYMEMDRVEPNAQQVLRLAELFGVSCDALLGRTDG